MENISSMNRNELLKKLKTHKKYKNLTRKEISEKLGNIDNLRTELTNLTQKTYKKNDLNINQPLPQLPQLPDEIISQIIPDIPITKQRLINKQYNKTIQEQFEQKNKKDILKYIVNNWDKSDITGIDNEMRDYGYAGYFENDDEDLEDFYNVQITYINNMSINDIIFYKKLINMIENKKILFVDEENYGFDKIDFFGFTSEGQLILHE